MLTVYKTASIMEKKKWGATDESRTHDLLITNQPL